MSVVRKYEESLKKSIVSEVESGELSLIEASREYGISRDTVKYWLESYGRFRPKHDVLEVVMRSEKERIEELEKALADLHLKNRLYEEIINLAGKKYKTDLKKTFGTVESGDSKGRGTKSKGSVK